MSLLAPEAYARVLTGPGAAHALLPWEGPETAALLAGEPAGGPVARALDAAEIVVAWTRSRPLVEAFEARTRRLVAHDPAPPFGGPHAARWLARAVEPLLGASVEPAQAGILAWSREEEREAHASAAALPERFVAVHPGSGSPAKNWALERFVEAARALAAGRRYLLIGGPAEDGLRAPADAVLARDWPLRRLGAVLARAGLFLGNDSGVSHLAAAAGAPTLALFGPTDPSLWAPVGPSVRTLLAPGGSLQALGVGAVLEAAAALRSAASGPRAG